MGKYDKLTLPPLPADHKEGGSEYQARVDLKKLDFANLTATQLAMKYEENRFGERRQFEDYPKELQAYLDAIGKEELEVLLKRKNLAIIALEQLLVDAYQAENLQSLKLDDGDSVSTQVEPYVVVVDKVALREWLKVNGHAELLETLVPAWQTINSMLKDRLLEGMEPPPGTEAYLRNKIVFRNGRG